MNFLFCLVCCCLWLLLVPLGMRRGVAWVRARKLSRRAVDGIYACYEVIFALNVFAAFVLPVLMVGFVQAQFGPSVLGVEVGDLRMSSVLTVGVFLYLVMVLCCPPLVFFLVGVTALRDTHQCCKELREQRFRRRNSGS